MSATVQWSQYNQRLMALLIEREGLLPDELQAVLSQTPHQPLERELLAQNRLSLPTLGQHLSAATQMPYLPLAKLATVDDGTLALLPLDFCQQKHLIPIGVENGLLGVAAVQPDVAGLADEITYLSGYRPKLHVISGSEWQDFWQARQRQHTTQLQETHHHEQTYVAMVEELLTQACQQQASDIHIEPKHSATGDQTVVRFRLDGVLVSHRVLSADALAGLIARLKVLANMDIAEHRRPQDGQFHATVDGQQLFCRVSSFPLSQHREKITLRLLRPFQSLMSFAHLGMTDADIVTIQKLLNQPHGIVLACGPTGSGKSTSIYAMVDALNTEARNITTIEDPVELELTGINQTGLNAKAQRDMETCLKAVLRQDPDVVMIGEIRDAETLALTLQAALTGHLMLSTFHANNAAGAITRMLDMGISAKLLSSGLAGIVAQRLVRQLCPHCKQAYEATPEEKQQLFPYNTERQQESLTLHSATGCPFCHHTGYKGRIGVFEMMPIDRELRYLISGGASELQLEDAAVANGMTTLSLNGRLKVLQGITTLTEITRVIGEA